MKTYIIKKWSRIDTSHFEDIGGGLLYRANKIKKGSFMKINKMTGELIHNGYDNTIRVWLKDGVIVELELLINI